MLYSAMQVQAASRGRGLDVLADNLACLSYSWQGCLRAAVLTSLSASSRDAEGTAAAKQLMECVDNGLLHWLQASVPPHEASTLHVSALNTHVVVRITFCPDTLLALGDLPCRNKEGALYIIRFLMAAHGAGS